MADGVVERPDGRAVVIFDGHCNLCNGAVDFLVRHDRHDRLVFTANQAPAGAALLAEHGVAGSDTETIFLVDEAGMSRASTAVLRISRLLPWPWRLGVVGYVVPRPLRDWLYTQVARRRYKWFGRKDTCRLPTPEEQAKFLA